MTPEQTDFRVGVIKPLECIKEGWAMIKDQYWLFFGITLVGMLIGSALAIVLMGPMMAGIFMCLFQRQRSQPVEFGLLFKGFDLFVPSLLVTVIKVIPIIILMVPYYIIMMVVIVSTMPKGRSGSPPDPSAFMASIFSLEIVFVLVVMVVGILIEIFFMFAYPLVVDRKLSAMDAVKLSMRAGKANFGGVLGLLLLNALFGIVGLLCCFVGVYFYLPVSLAAIAVAYRRVFPESSQPFPVPPPPPASWA